MDADYRARLARGWVEYNAQRFGLGASDVDAFADDFAQEVSGHEAWPPFVELQLSGAADPALEHLGWSSRARPLPFDHELVLLFDHREELGPQGSAVPAHRFYMRDSGDGWIVAGVDEEPPALSAQPG